MVRLSLAGRSNVAGIVLLLIASGVGAQSAKPSDAKTAAALRATQQQLVQHQSQVAALQKALEKEEAVTRQASDRLKQQDQAIEKMQQELQALHPAPAAGHR